MTIGSGIYVTLRFLFLTILEAAMLVLLIEGIYGELR
jgi:hypothetical protein